MSKATSMLKKSPRNKEKLKGGYNFVGFEDTKREAEAEAKRQKKLLYKSKIKKYPKGTTISKRAVGSFIPIFKDAPSEKPLYAVYVKETPKRKKYESDRNKAIATGVVLGTAGGLIIRGLRK